MARIINIPIRKLALWWLATAIILFGAITWAQFAFEEYKNISPDKFNGEIGQRTDIETPEELIRVYYRIDEIEDTFGITIEVEEPEKGRFEITLIQEGLEDDELAALKFVLFADHNGQTWTVTEIRKN